jgi:hypothetical protein
MWRQLWRQRRSLPLHQLLAPPLALSLCPSALPSTHRPGQRARGASRGRSGTQVVGGPGASTKLQATTPQTHLDELEWCASDTHDGTTSRTRQQARERDIARVIAVQNTEMDIEPRLLLAWSGRRRLWRRIDYPFARAVDRKANGAHDRDGYQWEPEGQLVYEADFWTHGKPRHNPPTPSSRMTSAARRGIVRFSRDDCRRDLSESSWWCCQLVVLWDGRAELTGKPQNVDTSDAVVADTTWVSETILEDLGNDRMIGTGGSRRASRASIQRGFRRSRWRAASSSEPACMYGRLAARIPPVELKQTAPPRLHPHSPAISHSRLYGLGVSVASHHLKPAAPVVPSRAAPAILTG